MNELLRQIKIVLLDIDGTLIHGSGDTIDHVVTQLRKLKPLGIRFSVATGRSLFGTQRIIRDMSTVGMKMPPVIAYNGAVVAWPDDTAILHRFTLSQGLVSLLLSEFRRRLITPFVYTCQDRFDASPVERVYGDVRSAVQPITDFNGMPICWVESFDEVRPPDVVAMLGELYDQSRNVRQTVEELQQAFGNEIRVTSSSNRYVEVAHAQSTKANGLLVLSRRLEIRPSQIMAIGDNFNDIDMLGAAGVGVAVANAPPAVQRAAQYVCKREAAEGVVEALRLLVAAIRHGRIESRVREEHYDAD